MTRRSSIATTAALLCCIITANAAAQQRSAKEDSMMTRAMTSAQRMRDPAQFVLDHGKELGLSPSQVATLNELVLALADSSKARLQSSMAGMLSNPGTIGGMGQALQQWDGPLDEVALRESLKPQLDMQASLMIGMVRDRRQVGAVLTPAQRAMLPRIEMDERMASFRKP